MLQAAATRNPRKHVVLRGLFFYIKNIPQFYPKTSYIIGVKTNRLMRTVREISKKNTTWMRKMVRFWNSVLNIINNICS